MEPEIFSDSGVVSSFEKPFFIMLTNKCNLTCKHCYNELDDLKAIKSKASDPLSLERLTFLFEQLSFQGYKKAYLSGGEALLRSDIIQIINSATKNNLKTALFTNGHLFTVEKIAELANAGLGEVRISLNELVWTKTEDQFFNALNKQVKWIPELIKKNINVGVIFILSKSNQNYYLETLKIIRSMGAGMKVQPLYLPHLVQDFNRVTVNNISEKEWIELIEGTRNFFNNTDMAQEKFEVYGNPWKILRYLNFISEVHLLGLKPDFCPTGPILVLDSDGQFHPCLFRYDLISGHVFDDATVFRIREIIDNNYPELRAAKCFKTECLSAYR